MVGEWDQNEEVENQDVDQTHGDNQAKPFPREQALQNPAHERLWVQKHDIRRDILVKRTKH
jgi:hypothetical protein